MEDLTSQGQTGRNPKPQGAQPEGFSYLGPELISPLPLMGIIIGILILGPLNEGGLVITALPLQP